MKLQVKWFFAIQQNPTLGASNWVRAWSLGARRVSFCDGFSPSRMIWLNDEYCDITINQYSDTARVRNGYGDINRAGVCFLDGHARYMRIIPGGEGDPNRITRPWLVPAYNNADYTVVFPFLGH